MPLLKTNLKIKAAAPWAGGKRKIASAIIEELGEYDTLVDVFVGGYSWELQAEKAPHEFLNDANPFLVNVLRCLRDYRPKLAEWLDATPFDRGEFELAASWVSDLKRLPNELGDCIELAASQLIVWWMGPNGLAGTTTKPWFATRHTKTGGSPETRWNSFRSSIPAISERLQGSEITNLDFRVLLGNRRFDSIGTAIYCDPPYLNKTFDYQFEEDIQADGSRKPFPHQKLAEALNAHKRARIVVSYYDDPLLDVLYPREKWRRRYIETAKNSANSVGKGRKKTPAVELLLVNDIGG